MLLFETATLRSGFTLNDQIGFAERVEQVRPPKSSKICLVCDHCIPVSTSYQKLSTCFQILRRTIDVSLDEPVEEEPEIEEEDKNEKSVEEKDETKDEMEHSEL